LTSLPELLRAAQAWRLVAYGALVVLIMIFRPEGLMGNWELTPANLRSLFIKIRDKLRPPAPVKPLGKES
jgi:hypothetical protein